MGKKKEKSAELQGTLTEKLKELYCSGLVAVKQFQQRGGGSQQKRKFQKTPIRKSTLHKVRKKNRYQRCAKLTTIRAVDVAPKEQNLAFHWKTIFRNNDAIIL